MKTKLLNTSKVIGLACLLFATAFYSAAYAATDECTFTTNEFHYASLLSPAETMWFKWRKSTGNVTSFYWLHGGVKWFSYVKDKGKIIGDKFVGDYHRRVNLGTTTAGFENSRFQVLGYLQDNQGFPDANYNATFAGTWEGTKSTWAVAYGNITCTPLENNFKREKIPVVF